jgi:predicted nucleic acid-binding protein
VPRRRSTLRPPIFIDASAWVAAANDRDQHYAVARSLMGECFEERVQLVTANWTAFEALSLLKSRAGGQLAADLWDLLTDPQAVDLVRVTEEIENRALELFFAYQDKPRGVVDCANLVVMEDPGCCQALGFDRHAVASLTTHASRLGR